MRLDYAALKRRLPGPPRRRRKTAQPAFVELIGPNTPRIDELAIEFKSRQGSEMRIQWKAPTAPDWTNLLRAWPNAEKE